MSDFNVNKIPTTVGPLDPTSDIGVGGMGAIDAGTFGSARYLAHLLGSKAFEEAQAKSPKSYAFGQNIGNVGSALVPGVGIAGKAIETAGNLGKGSAGIKALGEGIQNLGKSGTLGGMAARGAAEAGLNTEAHNIGNDLTGRSDENGNVVGSMGLGALAGGAGSLLGGAGKTAGKLATAADDTSLGYVGVGQRQLMNRVKNPTSNANSTTTMNNIMDVKQRASNLLDKYGFFKKDPTIAANEMQDDIKANFKPFDDAVKADPRGFVNGLAKNWQDQVNEIQNSKWASQKTKMGNGLMPVLDVGRDILSPTSESGILNDIATRVKAGGNLFDVRNLARSNAVDAFKTFSRTQDPIDGLQWDAWNRLGKSIDDTVDDMASGMTDRSIRSVGQDYGDAQMIADGLAHKEAAVKLGGNSATFGRGALSALMTGRGNPIADFVSQIGGSYIEKGTAGLGARIAHEASGPLHAASGLMNTPVANGMTAGEILKELSGPGSQFAARLLPNIQNNGQSQNLSPADIGLQPIAPIPTLNGNQFQQSQGPVQPVESQPFNHYEGMQGNGQPPLDMGHPAINAAYTAIKADSGDMGSRDAFNQAIMNGLANNWISRPDYNLLKPLLGPPDMRNPQFAQYVNGALYHMSNNGSVRDAQGNYIPQPDKAGEYLFLDPRDQEMYSKGINALRTINLSLPKAEQSTGLSGLANQVTRGMLGGPESIDALSARTTIVNAIEDLMSSQGRSFNDADVKDQINNILNSPFLDNQSRTKLLYDFMSRAAPKTFNTFTQAGVNPRSLQ